MSKVVKELVVVGWNIFKGWNIEGQNIVNVVLFGDGCSWVTDNVRRVWRKKHMFLVVDGLK